TPLPMRTTLLLSILGALFCALLFSGCFGYATEVTAMRLSPDAPPRATVVSSDWANVTVYFEVPFAPFDTLVRLEIDGGMTTKENGLFKRLQKEAHRYQADAVIVEDYLIQYRNTFNGFNAALNVGGLIAGAGYADLPMEEGYESLRVEAVAIRYVNDTIPSLIRLGIWDENDPPPITDSIPDIEQLFAPMQTKDHRGRNE
ncbi:MAG: hypothetical protein AAF840_07870, partial [Bacteroidota bacterium]